MSPRWQSLPSCSTPPRPQRNTPGLLRVPAIVIRILALALLAFAASRRRSLTGWIFVGMLAGIELGVDAPHIALSSRVFGDIFLRLIRVIVAPLIFGTLVTGIASHSEAKTVGRLGLKSLVYFETLTTIALFIGLVAINISKAGVGLNMSAHARCLRAPAADRHLLAAIPPARFP